MGWFAPSCQDPGLRPASPRLSGPLRRCTAPAPSRDGAFSVKGRGVRGPMLIAH